MQHALNQNEEERERRLDDAIGEVIQLQQAGKVVRLVEFQQRYPDLADSLAEIWSALVVVNRLGKQSSDSSKWVGGEYPSVLGDFQLTHEIGRGGMGVVFEAKQVSLDRPVAVKVLARHLAKDPQCAARFLRESRSAALLQHPRIVPVFGNGCDGEYSYYAMQLIHGNGLNEVLQQIKRVRQRVGDAVVKEAASSVHDLSQVLISGHLVAGVLLGTESQKASELPLPANLLPRISSQETFDRVAGSGVDSSTKVGYSRYLVNVAGLIKQVAEALQYAHAHGVVHRDIKPSNLILDHSGVIWVTDFGLAKVATHTSLTNAGDMVGTLTYVAPEQLEGIAAPSCDIYGLGATLYELITLNPVIPTTDRLLVLEHIRNKEPVPPRVLDPTIPLDLQTIALKAIAKSPIDRYQTAQELADDLQRFLDGRPILARQVSSVERTFRWARRNWQVASLLCLVAVMVMLGSVVSIISHYRGIAATERVNREAAELSQKTEVAARAIAEEAEEKTRHRLYVSEINNAYLATKTRGGLKRVREILKDWQPQSGKTDLRGWEWYFLRAWSDQAEIEIASDRQSNSVAWSPTQDQIAWNSERGIEFLLLATQERWYLPCRLHWAPSIRFSADGKRVLAVLENCHLAIWNLSDRTQEWEIENQLSVAAVSWSSDQRWIAYACIDGGNDRIVIYDLQEKKHGPELGRALVGWSDELNLSVWPMAGFTTGVNRIEFSPDSRHLAANYWAGTRNEVPSIGVWRTSDWKMETAFLCPDEYIASLQWSPDGRQLAGADFFEGQLSVFDVASASKVATRQQAKPVTDMDWSPDGRWIVSAHADASVTLVDAKTLEEVESTLAHPSKLMSIRFSPDSKKLLTASAGDAIRVWDIFEAESHRVFQLPKQKDVVELDASVRWKPDGTQVAAGAAFPASVFEVETGEQRFSIEGSYLEWNHDGKFLASKFRDPVSIWDAATGAVVKEKADLQDWVLRDWSPCDNRLAGVAFNELWIWNTEDGATRRYTIIEPAMMVPMLTSLAWNPDASAIAVGTKLGDVYLVAVDSGEMIHRKISDSQINSISWKPDGSELAVAGHEGTLHVLNQQGEPLRDLVGHSLAVWSVDWSHDSKRLVSGSDSQLIIWDPETGTSMLQILTDEILRGVAWSPDDRRIATVSQRGMVSIWTASPE